MLCRGGAITVAETTALGVPAVYVPYPHSNQEQKRNALPVVEAGGGLLVDNAELTPEWIERTVIPLVRDPQRLAAMGARRRRYGRRDGDEALLDFVCEAVARADDAVRPSEGAGPVNTAELTPAGELTAEDLGSVHLIGIGGVGMGGLARLLLTRGVPVSGSELREWPALAALRALGGTVHMAHEASNLDGVDTVVYSTAIPQDHLELVEARRRGLRVLHRSEALAAAMTGRQTIAVAGTHGKTTTTSIMTVILQHAGQDPSFVIGGEISEAGSNGAPRHRAALRGRGGRERQVVPDLPPARRDHHQHRGRPPQQLGRPGRAEGRRSCEFAELTDADGFVVTCADDPGTQRADRRRCAPRAGPFSRTARRPAPTCGSSDVVSIGQRGALPGRAGRRAARRDQAGAARPAHGPEQRRRRAHRAAAGPAAGNDHRGAGRRSRGCGAGSSARASPPASGSTTSTRTTRPR